MFARSAVTGVVANPIVEESARYTRLMPPWNFRNTWETARASRSRLFRRTSRLTTSCSRDDRVGPAKVPAKP
jgi:hypothetical protein